MRKSIVQRELDEILGGSEFGESCEMQVHQPTYQPTSWLMINRVLDVVDRLTGGRAGWVQRFFSFAVIANHQDFIARMGGVLADALKTDA